LSPKTLFGSSPYGLEPMVMEIEIGRKGSRRSGIVNGKGEIVVLLRLDVKAVGVMKEARSSKSWQVNWEREICELLNSTMQFQRLYF
jgi:hypothetical protein